MPCFGALQVDLMGSYEASLRLERFGAFPESPGKVHNYYSLSLIVVFVVAAAGGVEE